MVGKHHCKFFDEKHPFNELTYDIRCESSEKIHMSQLIQ